MTRITIFYGGRNTIRGFMLEGHTGFSERGSDIVCSAVTTTAMTAVNGLTDVVGAKAAVRVRDGFIKCILSRNITKEQARGAEVLLKSTYLTFKNIELQYRDYVVIFERRCTR